MGIYIKDFKMPEGGYRTIEIAYDADGYPMAITDGGDVFDVISAPPHGRLIDADALLSKDYQVYNEYGSAIGRRYLSVYDIQEAPTIIPAEEDINIQKEFMQNWHEEDSE